ncbi:MAG: hypothetical protein WAM65_11270, partial [Candidatus Korobacteraceae bacterium]
TTSHNGQANQQAAQLFLDQLQGTREVTETEPGLFRRTETTGEGYKVFTLTSLLPKYAYTVHLAKMAYTDSVWQGVQSERVVR